MRSAEKNAKFKNIMHPNKMELLWQNSSLTRKPQKDWHILTNYQAESCWSTLNIPLMYNLVLWNRFLIKQKKNNEEINFYKNAVGRKNDRWTDRWTGRLMMDETENSLYKVSDMNTLVDS